MLVCAWESSLYQHLHIQVVLNCLWVSSPNAWHYNLDIQVVPICPWESSPNAWHHCLHIKMVPICPWEGSPNAWPLAYPDDFSLAAGKFSNTFFCQAKKTTHCWNLHLIYLYTLMTKQYTLSLSQSSHSSIWLSSQRW